VKYRRALLLADLRADPGPALSALRRVAPALERILVVGRVRGIGSWWSTDDAREPDARDLAALDGWRAAAAAVAPTETRHAPGLTIDALVDLALTDGIDLLVAGARAFDSALLVQSAARRIGVAALWPAGPPRTTAIAHVSCAAVGQRALVAIAELLREQADPALEFTVIAIGVLRGDELSDDLQVAGVRARVAVLPRSLSPLRAALETAERSGPVDLVVLARVHTLQLLRYDWPAPVLVVPPAIPSAARRTFDITDVVDIQGTIRARVDEAALGSLPPAADTVLALVADGKVVASGITTPWGELDLPAGIEARSLGAVRVVDESTPDALAAVEHRFAVIRPGARPFVLFDCELPDERLRTIATLTAADSAEPLAVRLRPTRKAAAIRQRLQAAGLPAHVVDARTVLDEGDAHDVAETNDPVRLWRVAAKLRSAGFRIASIFHRSLDKPEPITDTPTGSIAGNRIEVELDNLQARTWLLDAIARSCRSVSVQVYMASDDEIGKAVDAALAAAGARGVTVRVLVDSLHGLHGSFGTANPLLSRLGARSGVELRVSRPVTTFPSLADLKQRDHRKIVVVDDRVALVGGRNFSHEYYTGFDEVHLTASALWRQVPWLDGGARIEGPAVAAIAAAFVDAWTDAGGASFAIDVPPPAGSTVARVVVHRGLRDACTLEAYLELIERARSHLYVVNGFPYLLELQRALLRAIRRGVRVRVLSGHLTPMHDGTPFAGPWSAARTTGTEFVHSRLDPIVEAGGEVYLFAQRDRPGWDPGLGTVSMHVHAKVMSADGVRCAVGSANFDVTSSYWESELMLLVEDAAVAGPLERRIDELLAASPRIDRDDPTWREHARRRQWMRRWPGVLHL
jgi:phosphatidylserine/phosphatidylglycerophosphate/cardiolipin synthase-like enzyme